MHRIAFVASLAGICLASISEARPTAIGGGITLTLSRPGMLQPGKSTFTPFPNPCGEHRPVCRPEPCHRPWVGWAPPCDGGIERTVIVYESGSPERDPTPARAEPEQDPGMVALRQGAYQEAAGIFLRAHMAQLARESEEGSAAAVDRRALRLHALALLGAGECADSATAFARAHTEDPTLRFEPLDGPELLGSASETRSVMLKAMRFAKRTGTAEGWSMVGYLKQAQGKSRQAGDFFARAAAAQVASPGPAGSRGALEPGTPSAI